MRAETFAMRKQFPDLTSRWKLEPRQRAFWFCMKEGLSTSFHTSLFSMAFFSKQESVPPPRLSNLQCKLPKTAQISVVEPVNRLKDCMGGCQIFLSPFFPIPLFTFSQPRNASDRFTPHRFCFALLPTMMIGQKPQLLNFQLPSPQ